MEAFIAEAMLLKVHLMKGIELEICIKRILLIGEIVRVRSRGSVLFGCIDAKPFASREAEIFPRSIEIPSKALFSEAI